MKRKPLDNCDSCPFTAEEVADMYLRANLTVALEEYFLEQQVSHAQISHLLGIALPWVKDLMDGKAEKFIGNEKASHMLSREYRKPYVVPEITV